MGTGLNDDVEALDKALDEYNAKTGYEIPIHVDAATGGFILRSSTPTANGTSALNGCCQSVLPGHKFGPRISRSWLGGMEG